MPSASMPAIITQRVSPVNTQRVRQKSRFAKNQGMALHEQIKRLREQAGMTQEQLALKCGFPGQSRIGNYEAPPERKSHREPSVADLKALARALDTSVVELLEEPMPSSGKEIEQIKVVLTAILSAIADHGPQLEGKAIAEALSRKAAETGDSELSALAAIAGAQAPSSAAR